MIALPERPQAYWSGVSPDPETGRVKALRLHVLHSQGEAMIDIHPSQPLIGETPAPQALQAQLELLRDVLNQLLARPESISLHPHQSG